ncbi:gluconate 2-dehydrogenase subunit 3 family protein [Mechercharimyces sp. CAU 1602]|uniref:gluconate 2-dehydrogenase subunit 3 family protein n=1 Tax=Mechercharimyces sp. CAU 1602 TaxID=2973933 RepID=UPI0021616140|nr:gluconate 2-dehydrogenase subunit 3 family protein [Mechercharimyces sp. CAU 1602]MCS1352158.1 gluconate 2-dehydrogenase subunit 3 family protein [Mechercharimyces sp. CAU 1602]
MSSSPSSNYPTYDVMKEKENWDKHTQQIVNRRLSATTNYHYLTQHEANLIRILAHALLYDGEEEILTFIIAHIDETLHSSPGEGQREEHVPPAPTLVRSGLKALEKTCNLEFKQSIPLLKPTQLDHLLTQLSQGEYGMRSEWRGLPSIPFFKKLLTLTVEAYTAHPTIWSEIGYGGPAYPRGYVRAHLGQRDPWEAEKS